MPTLRQLITRFTADTSDLDRAYAQAESGANDYAKTSERANEQATTSAEDAGAKIEDALKKPYEGAQDTIMQFASKHPYAIVAVATIALIAKEVVAWQAHKKAVEESTAALWEQSRALADAAVKAGEYGKAMGKAISTAEEETRTQSASAYVNKVSDEAATKMLAYLRQQAQQQAAAYEEAELGKGRFSTRWSDRLSPFGSQMMDKYEAESAEAKKQLDYINKRIEFYKGIKALHSQQAKEASAAAQAKLAADSKAAAEAQQRAGKEAASKQAAQAKAAEREAEQAKRAEARELALAAKQNELARTAQAKQAAARIYIQAEQAADEYDRKRLEIKAKHLETLRGLEKAGASEEEYQLANLRTQNALKAVTEAQESAQTEILRKQQEQASAEREAILKRQAQEQAVLKKQLEGELAAYTKEIEANARAQKDAAMSQVGFTGLRGMWQRGMEAGARERFWEPPSADNATGREMIRQQKQITLLEGILGKLGEQVNKTDKLLAEFRG